MGTAGVETDGERHVTVTDWALAERETVLAEGTHPHADSVPECATHLVEVLPAV